MNKEQGILNEEVTREGSIFNNQLKGKRDVLKISIIQYSAASALPL